jgi:hypothetical protein
MGLNRHPALQPFSRDHLIGLFHAQRLIKLQENYNDEILEETITAFEDAWQREISVHFADEDRLLGPLPITLSNLKRLHDEHVDLTALIKQLFEKPCSFSVANKVGAFLDAHIRWEEHELFPEIESTLSDLDLAALGKETDMIEKSRHRKLL